MADLADVISYPRNTLYYNAPNARGVLFFHFIRQRPHPPSPVIPSEREEK